MMRGSFAIVLALIVVLSDAAMAPKRAKTNFQFSREAASLWQELLRYERADDWTYSAQDQWPPLCQQGQSQSPINIDLNATTDYPGLALVLPFACSEGELFNNGHTVEYELEAGTGPFATGTSIYPESAQLLQFHFHRPSEHTIDGIRYDLELHFVHMTASGRLAVAAFLYRVGARSDWLDQFFFNLPQNNTVAPRLVDLRGVYAGATPRGRFVQYTGSLTTPPCREGVEFHVFTTILTLSADQLAQYPASLSPPLHPTNRNLQALNGRKLYYEQPQDTGCRAAYHCKK